MQTTIRWTTALCLAGMMVACSNDDGGFTRHDGTTPLAGTYVSADADAVTVPVTGDTVRLEVTASLAAALPDVSGLPTCPAAEERTDLPDHLVAFQLSNGGTYDIVEVQSVGDDRCYVHSSGEYDVDGKTIQSADGRVATLTQGPDDGQVTLVFDETPTPPAGLVDLGDSDPALDALNGTWALSGITGNVLRISENPEHIEHELVRQVGRAEDPTVPFPTRCHFVYEGDAYTLIAGEDALGAPTTTLRYPVPRLRLVDDPGNDPACAAYVAAQAQDAAAGRLHQAWDLTLDGDRLVLNGTESYTRVP